MLGLRVVLHKLEIQANLSTLLYQRKIFGNNVKLKQEQILKSTRIKLQGVMGSYKKR